MKRFLTTTAVTLFIGAAPALAVDDSSKIDGQNTMPQASQPDSSKPSDAQTTNKDEGQLPTQSTVSPDVAKEAVEPDAGERDTSGGAMERSSAPPESGAATSGSADADLVTPDSEVERGPASAQKPDSQPKPDASKE